jgi:hypothetical protein
MLYGIRGGIIKLDVFNFRLSCMAGRPAEDPRGFDSRKKYSFIEGVLFHSDPVFIPE